MPLGFGMIEELPDFVPLLERLRADVGRRDRSLADELLPKRQLADPHDNMQRLLRVLDRDGSAGLLSGAMDGGVPVELFRGRNTPYWAVFRVRRTRQGTAEGEARDGRDMEYITSAATQRADTRETSDTRNAEGVVAGAGKPEGGGGPLKSVGGSGGLGVGVGDVTKSATVGRGQLGMKTVAEASARSVRMRVPIEATLELHSSRGRVGLATLGGQSLVHRILVKDLEALSRLRPVPRAEAGQAFLRQDDAEASLAGALARPRGEPADGGAGQRVPRRSRDPPGDRRRGTGGARRGALPQDGRRGGVRAARGGVHRVADLRPATAHRGGGRPSVVHASGAQGQDLRTLTARPAARRACAGCRRQDDLRDGGAECSGRAPAHGHGPPAGGGAQQVGTGLGGAGVLNADEFRMNQLLGNADQVGGATDTSAHGSGSMPLHKPKSEATLVQFTLDVRVVARVRDRGRSGAPSVAVRDFTVPTPVVVRIPAPVARRMLQDPSNHTKLDDPDGRLTS
ncbi:hypothetical protein HEP87_58310 [Streptomyces sp. S1D4-11]